MDEVHAGICQRPEYHFRPGFAFGPLVEEVVHLTLRNTNTDGSVTSRFPYCAINLQDETNTVLHLTAPFVSPLIGDIGKELVK
ncbi:hypothetical protein D3C85_1782190 [compost metagenome]